MMPRVHVLCLALILSLCLAGLCLSQTVSATLLGNVTDVSGAVVPNAKVTITETNTGVSRTGQTNESGNYSFTNLPPGMYSVSVEATGFKKETQRNVNVQVDTNTRADLTLSPGA